MYLFVFIDRIIHRRDSQDFFKEPVRTVPEQDIEKAAKNDCQNERAEPLNLMR